MSLFKQMVENDIRSTFLNMDEFADVHSIDGSDVVCVVDTNTGAPDRFEATDGIYMDTKRVFFHDGDYEPPAIGEVVSLDGSYHRLRAVSREMGVTMMTLEGNMSL